MTRCVLSIADMCRINSLCAKPVVKRLDSSSMLQLTANGVKDESQAGRTHLRARVAQLNSLKMSTPLKTNNRKCDVYAKRAVATLMVGLPDVRRASEFDTPIKLYGTMQILSAIVQRSPPSVGTSWYWLAFPCPNRRCIQTAADSSHIARKC